MNSLYDKYYLNEKNILHIIQEGIIVFDTSAPVDLLLMRLSSFIIGLNQQFCQSLFLIFGDTDN